jgi:hypothetical protein
MMDPEELERLKSEHGYEAWWDRTTLEENLFVWRFFLTGRELADWTSSRIRQVASQASPAIHHSFWRPREEKEGDIVLRMDIHECESRLAAHEFLLYQLGAFQSPMVARREGDAIGDVAFATPEEYCVLFSRGNMVFLLRNAGKELVPLPRIAGDVDADLSRKPEVEGGKVVPHIGRFEAPGAKPQVGVGTPLALEAEDPLDRPLMYKFFSKNGDVRSDEGKLQYVPAVDGPQDVTVFAVNVDRAAATESLHLDVP